MRAEDSLLRRHYADLAAKGFFPELIRYMSSGPVLPMVWQGLNAVKQGRAMLGATNPKVPRFVDNDDEEFINYFLPTSPRR